MFRKLLRLFEKVVPPAWRIPVLGLLFLLIVGVVLLKGSQIWNGIGSRFHDWRVSVAKKEIQKFKDEASESKKVAEGAIAAYEAEKKIAQEEKAKREIAEKVLADKTKNTDQKLEAYRAAVNARPTASGPESTDELCRRSAALGIPCN